MDDTRGKKLSNRRESAASRIAAVGKENICPALRSKEHLGASRSPLPQGFPRAPLQDITHILSPINVLPCDDDATAVALGQCIRGRKRAKCVAETQTSICVTRSESELTSSEAWRGLKKCGTLQAVTSDVGGSKLTKAESENSAHVGENCALTEEARLAHSVEVEEDTLLFRERVGTEVYRAVAVGTLHPAKSPEATLKRTSRSSVPTPATRASSRSSQQMHKTSSLMKFR